MRTPVHIPRPVPKSQVMRRYTVVFDLPSAAGKRTRIVAAGRKRTAAALRDMLAFVREHGLEAELGAVGAPTVFGVVAVEATSSLAARLRNAPGVVRVRPE